MVDFSFRILFQLMNLAIILGIGVFIVAVIFKLKQLNDRLYKIEKRLNYVETESENKNNR